MRELYYYSLDNKVMAVEIRPSVPGSQQFQYGVPKVLFEVRIGRNNALSFDVSKDGRFLLPALATFRLKIPPVSFLFS